MEVETTSPARSTTRQRARHPSPQCPPARPPSLCASGMRKLPNLYCPLHIFTFRAHCLLPFNACQYIHCQIRTAINPFVILHKPVSPSTVLINPVVPVGISHRLEIIHLHAIVLAQKHFHSVICQFSPAVFQPSYVLVLCAHGHLAAQVAIVLRVVSTCWTKTVTSRSPGCTGSPSYPSQSL